MAQPTEVTIVGDVDVLKRLIVANRPKGWRWTFYRHASRFLRWALRLRY